MFSQLVHPFRKDQLGVLQSAPHGDLQPAALGDENAGAAPKHFAGRVHQSLGSMGDPELLTLVSRE